jgi:hypothetical protein
VKDQKQSDRNSASSINQLINDAHSSDGRQTPIKKTAEVSKTKKKASDLVPSQVILYINTKFLS